MEDKLLGLYNDFKDAGLFKDTKDFGTFKKRMQGAGYQSQIYKVAKDNGADVGQFWQFQRNFGLGRWSGKGSSLQQSKPNAQQSELVQAANRVAANYQARNNSEAYKAGQGMWGAKGGTRRSNGLTWRQNHPTVAKIYDTIGNVAEGIGNYFEDAHENSAGRTNDRVKEIRDFMPNQRRQAAELQRRLNESGLASLTKKDSEMTPSERMQASRLRKGMQAGVAATTAEENRRMNNPITASRVGKGTAPTSNELLVQLGTDKARQARIKQQHMDDAAQLAYQGVGQNLGNDIFNEVDKGIEQGKQNSIDFMAGAVDDRNRMLAMQNDDIAESVFKAAQGQNSTEAIQKIVGQSVMGKVNDYFSRPEIQKNVLDSAKKMNMAPEVYVQEYVMPSLMQYAKDAVSQRKLENEIPKSFWGYLAKNASNSILGMMVQLGSQTQENRQLRQQALAVAEGADELPQMAGHKNVDYYHAGIGSRFVGSAANMLLDSGPLGAIGAGADAAVSAGARILARGLAKAGIKDAVKLTAREAAFKAANMTMAQKITSGLLNNVPRSALNLGGYSAITSALGQASTGEDTSLGAIAAAGIEGFKHGAMTGSLFGLTGSLTRPWAQRYGINGTERTTAQRRLHAAQKLGAETASLGAEAGTMMVADNLTSDKEISAAQFLEDGVMVMSFRLGEPKNYKHLGSALYNLTHDTSKSPITLTQDERNELMNSTSGKNLMDVFSNFNKVAKSYPRIPSYGVAYSNFMNDPEVSRSTKEKVNAALGVPSQTFKVSQRSVNDVQNKQILEYSSDGTLLSRTSYKNAEQRRAILFRQKSVRDNMHVLNLLGYAKLKERQYLDDNNQITPLAAKFLNSKGYDLSKEPTEDKNARLISDMQDKNSDLYKEWLKYADKNVDAFGMTDEIKKILTKDPMRRTDEEAAKIKEYRSALETQLFPDSKPNLEQAENQGRAIAEDNDLGSDNPKAEVVVATLNNLSQAEKDLEAAYNSSDNLKLGLIGLAEELGAKPQGEDLSSVLKAIQGTGITNPQIFGMLADSNGKFIVSESELEPFSRYMMTLHRAQGMQNATAQAINEHVGMMAQDWGFHGTMDGEKADGSQVLYVQDRDGRTLIVGSGDVSYDPTDGRAKEGVGDMLVCLDPNTRETVYVRAEDTTLFQTQDVEAFKNEERQRLQQINSVPYNQAAQEQAAAEAAKPQQKEVKGMSSSNSSDMHLAERPNGGSDLLPTPEADIPSGGKDTNNSLNNNENNTSLTFKDGSAVPVDANGEPDFMQMTPEQSVEVYKQLFPKTYEAEVDNTIKMLEADLRKVRKATPKSRGITARAKEQAEIEKAVALAEAQLAKAKEIKKALEKEKIGDNVAIGTKENVTRYEQEREQGYRMGKGGVRYDRQKKEDVGGVRGKEVVVAFSPTVEVKGHAKLVELDTVQASHNNGQMNMMHFGPDWQPKDRASEASKVDAAKMAGNMKPKNITGSGNAFINSAPSVNERHETIQGNNRVEALKQMYSGHSEQAAKYKQWLMDHAEEFGLRAEDISKMEKPVIVNELPVDDAMAKELGQMSVNGFESGGSRIPDVVATINKMGDETQGFANVLLAEHEGMNEETSLGELINANAARTLEWLYNKGFIDNTEYENLYKDADKKRDWLNGVLKTSLFDGDRTTEAAFNNLPNKAKRAVLATFMRDMRSGDSDKIKTNIKRSFEAYYDLESNNKAFKNAKNIDAARKAVQSEVLNGSNSVFADAPIREKYTNFELELAALYKGTDQKSLTALFNRFYDAVQGATGKDLFEQGEDSKPLSKDEAIEKVFETNNDLANDRRRETEPSSPDRGRDGAEQQGGNGEGTEQTTSVNHGRKEVLQGGDAGEVETSESERVHLEELGRTFKLGKGVRNNAGSGEGETQESEGAKLEAYAKESGIWRDNVKDYIENELGATYLGQGGESYVYEKGDSVYKDRPLNFNTIHESIDNFLIAHELSPESGYEIVAVGPKDKMGQYHVVLRQKKYTMDLEHPVTAEEIDKWFADRGFKKSIDEFGNAEYRKGDILITDGIDSNFARDPETGKIVPIDLQCFREAKADNEEQADKLAGVESDAEQKIDDYIAEHYPHHNGVRARTKEEQAAYDAETEAMKNDETLKQMRKEADEAFDEAKTDKIKILPEEDNTPDDPTNPFETIAKAADDFKKDHPMTEEEIMAVDGLDDEAKYTAIDYLNGEDDSEVARICYEQAYAKRGNHTTKSGENVPQSGENRTTSEKEDTTFTTNPMETIEKAAAEYENEKGKSEPSVAPKTIAEKKAAAKKLKEESDKKTQELMNQFLAAKDEKKDGSGKALSTLIPIPSKALKWMDRNLTLTDKQKEILPKLLTAIKGSMYARIKEGIYNLEDVIENVRKDFKTFFDALDKDDANKILAEAAYKGRFTDPETGERIKLSEAAERERKMTPEHKEKLVGDSKDAEDRKQKENKFINRIQLVITLSKFKTGIVGLRKIAEDCGLKDIKDTDLQELAETAVVMRARDIANSKATSDEVKFKQIKRLYENQPSLNQRDSERVLKQQYSTPAPYAFLADMYLKGNGKVINSALEPSAGNGMLTIGLPKDKVHVNDIDEARLMNLHRQGFKNITSQDGTQPFADKDVDVVVTNPPFGSSTPKDYDGYRISSLEGQMAINALESMKDDGRAAIIIGGKTEYAKNGSLMPKDKAFLGYLYSHYNVEDVINVDGSLYAKQGTSYPTRIILINGRRLDENAFPPVKDKARAETVKDYDELYKRINDDILRGRGVDTSIRNERRNVEPELDRQGSKDTSEKGVRVREHRGGKQTASVLPDGLHEESSVSGTNDALGDERGAEREVRGNLLGGTSGGDGAGANASESERRATNADGGNGGQQPEPRGAGRHAAQPSTDGTSISRSGGRLAVEQQKKEEKRDLSSEKVTYSPKSGNPFTLQSVMPADQQEAVNKNLAKLGDADQFLVDELGYNDKDDLYKHLAAEQVDAVALAIRQAKQGNAFIIGDMTGIGKGRQAASLIRYAKKQGQIPVYFTQKAMLLSDVYRDLVDIGNPELRPFIFGRGSDFNVTDAEGNLVYKYPSEKEVKRVLDYIDKNGTLPKEYDYVLTTYSQVGNGIYEYGEDGTRKERKIAKGKKFDSGALNGQQRRDAIEKLIGNGYLIMDESHTVAGESGQGNYFQHIIQKAKNVTFFSATFAKRPDNMPIYALRTAMNQGGLKASDLIDAVKRGGATLQEIMSQTLTKCGQMIRRERDMTGVTIDWKAIDDPEKVEEQRAQYDSIIGLFNDIINFQRTYVSDYVENRNKELAAIQSSMGIKRGTAALGIKNTPFASKAFNTVQQVLLSLKAKSAAERAVEYLKQGMKPVIALNNTNESQTDNLAIGEEMDAPDLGTSLKKGLEGTLRYTQKDAKNNSESGYIKLSDLGDDAIAAYHELEKKIEQTSTGLSLSPIDVIKNELEKAGYKVGELTGRQTEFVYNDNGTVTKVKRTNTDKKKIAREFNDGQIDALILNKSAATGISLHASSKFKDQRKRVMIVAQQQLDVNDEVQMRGRIDRTGQILRGAYEYVVSLIPAEQRLLMMFKAKLKSLDANTTSSQKSKFNEMEVADITNKYGDKVVREYMAEHLDLYSRMADPFGWEKAYGDDISTIDPQKLATTRVSSKIGEVGSDASTLLGRMALLKVVEQEKMLQEIGDLYAAEINRLNEMGENDLEITELPLKAKTIGREVWKQGTEPDGDNAFADNTYIEKVNMAILKKPMKAQEVQTAQEGLTGGRSWDEYRDSKKAEIKNYFDQKIADATQKNEERAVKLATAAKEKYMKDAKRGQKDSGMSDEQIEQMAGYQYDNIYKEEKDKLKEIVKNIKAKADAFERVLDTFNTEDAYVLPADMNNPNEMSSFGNSYGRLIDIKITDNFSPNASSVSFATLDGRRKITFPVSGKVGAGENKADVISAIYRMTQQASSVGDKHLRVLSMDTANWDKLVSNESRKDGYIITGNLMQALIDTKEQGLGGQLVKYTTDGGDVKTGILMPDRFEPNDVSVESPISSVEDKFHKRLDEGGIVSIKSSDDEVEIIQKYNHYDGDFEYQIRVPKSQKRGGKYFLDKDLCKMMGGGNFETRGNSMLGEFKEKNLHNVLNRLSNLGVKVREERQSSEEEGTHFRTDRGVQYSKTDEKDVKNSRIIPEDVDKSVSSQIEKKFDDTINDISSSAEDKFKEKAQEIINRATSEYSGKTRDALETEKTAYENEIAQLHRWTAARSGRSTDSGKALGDSYIVSYNRTHIAAIDRELAYRDARAKAIRDAYGLSGGDKINFDTVERIFKEGNPSDEQAQLFSKAYDIAKRLGVNFGLESDINTKSSGEADVNRNINLFLDGLTKTRSSKDSLPRVMLHEMLHQATMGAINLVKKGKAEGMLTPKQIEGVKTILDLYNKVKDDKERFKEESYGLQSEYEFAAQMADPRQRKALDLDVWDRIKNAAHELANKGDRSMWQTFKDAVKKLFEISDKDKMDQALNDIMDDFNEKIDDISMNEIEQDGFAYKVEDKDELDRKSSEDLFNSLKDKENDRKEYNDTVTELAHRMGDGSTDNGGAEETISPRHTRGWRSRMGRYSGSIKSGFKSAEHCAAAIIGLDCTRGLPEIRKQASAEWKRYQQRRKNDSLSYKDDTSKDEWIQENVLKTLNGRISERIEDWAKQNNSWLDWGYFDENYPTKNKLGDGTEQEADVFRSVDGKTVVKFVRPEVLYGDSFPNPAIAKLEEIALENYALRTNERKVIGFFEGDMIGGTPRIIVEQPFVEGKTVHELFGDKETTEGVAFIDKAMAKQGFKKGKVIEDTWLGDMEFNVYYKDGIVLQDVNTHNVIVDNEGNAHVIDCVAEPNYGQYEKFGIPKENDVLDEYPGATTFIVKGKNIKEEAEEDLPSNSTELYALRSELENQQRRIKVLQGVRNSSNKEKIDSFLKDAKSKIKDLKQQIKELESSSTHFRSDDSAVRIADDAPVVVKHVDKIAKKLGAKVNMVQSTQEITNKAARAAIERGDKVTGWYDEKTGEVHLYMPNIHDRYTAEKTIWHEVVGHKGMRELFGDENYSKFLRSLWYDLDKPENARLKELVSEELKYNPLDFENGIEEGIARLVEDGKGEPGFWNNIKNKVTDILHEIGYRIAPNTKDVKYLLWLSKNLQKNPNDMVWKMRAEAVRHKLDRENTPAMIAKDGVFYTNDGKARSLNDLTKKEFDEATDGQIHFRTTPSAATALDRYHKSLDAHGYMFTESYMDNMLSLKNLMQAIVPDAKNIVDIKSSENPYMLQNTMQGAMSDAANMFERNVMKPLDKAMAEVLDAFEGKKDDEKIKNFNLYMITKHGLERNRILFMRDTLDDMRKDEKQKKNVDVIEKDWYDELADLNERLDRGDIDLKGYFDGIDNFIRLEVDSKFDAGKHDYSGIHAIQGIKKSSDPYDDAEAIASVMDAEASMEGIKKGSVKAYWDKVNAATQYAIDTDYKNGLISKELYGHVSEMFNWYVPLRKYDEATAEDTYGYITEKGDPKNFIGSTIMRARGHKYLSETNVLAQIGAMGNRAIKNGGQNAIKQAFARFIRNHSDNNLVTETSVWYVDDPVTQTTKERYPDIPEDATPDEVNQIVSDFNAEMRDLESKGLASKVRRRGRIGYKFERAENRSQHIVDVKIAGKTHSFVINGNPRAAQALNGLLEHKNTTFLGKTAATISRFMAQTCTSYNPEFVMRNMVRDFEFASSNLLAKEGFRYTALFEKYYAQVGLIEGIRNTKLKDFKDTGGFGLFAKYRNGTLDTSDKIQRYFKEFMENGGETGWVQVKNMKDLTKEYKSHIKAERNGVVKVGKGIYDAIFKNLENVNEVAENMARFATYCASRDCGRTMVRSAYDAKEVSTNFNRHGSGGEIKSFKNGEMGAFKERRKIFYGFSASYLRNCSMFFNAGIQSTNLLIKNFKTNPISTGAYIAAAPFMSGALMALVNNMIIAGEDEKDRNGVRDPYGELPDYIRRNNLCVYIGGGEFITVPLAIEERAFYGLGDLAAGKTFSPNIESTRSWYADAIGSASQLVPVLDYLGNKTVDKDPWAETLKATLPSATSPFVEWAFNSDWKGAPIERENSFDENQPAWMRAYRGTPEVLINLNKKVNAMTNDVAKGNEDMLGNRFLDAVTNPSGIQHFYGGFLGGAATFVERTAGLIKNGKDTETKDIPFVRSLLYTPSEQTSLQRTKSKWYNYVDEMETTMANIDRLKSKNVPIDKRLQNMADYYHFQNSADAAKVRIIELAQKQMKQWKKMRDRATDTESVKFANQNIDKIMMEAVDELDRME